MRHDWDAGPQAHVALAGALIERFRPAASTGRLTRSQLIRRADCEQRESRDTVGAPGRRIWVRRWSGGAYAAEGAGEHGYQPSLDLLLGFVPELGADRREDQPVQQPGCAARAEDQLPIPDPRNVGL